MKYFSILFLSFLAMSVQANYQCWGKVTYIGVDDALHVDTGFGVHKLCVLTGNGNADENDKCKSWLAMAMSAQAQGKPLHVYYWHATEDSSNAPICGQIGSWVTPAHPVYFVSLQ